MKCDRCGEPAAHRPNIRGEVVKGWAVLCCHHADLFMAQAARSVHHVEGALGFRKWVEAHDRECGAIGAAPADYFEELARDAVVEVLPEFGGAA